MPINPYEQMQQAQWGGKPLTADTNRAIGGRLGGGMEKGSTGKTPNVAWTENQLKPSPKAPNAQPGATADMARADYRADAPPAAKEGRRRGAFGSGGGGRGGYSAGGDININLGDNAAVGRGNRAGTGNINGDNNDFSGNSGQIGGSGNRMTAPSRRGTRGAPTSPAGSPPAGTPAAPAPTPGGGKKRTPTPVGGAPTPRALPSGPTPTPAVGTSPTTPTSPPSVGSGPKPKAIGPGTPETPTPATPTGTKDVRTRQQKIEDLANDPGATPGERSAAQGKLGETPSGPKTAGPERPSISGPKPGRQQPTTGFDQSEKADYDVANYGTDDNYSGTNDAPKPTAPASKPSSKNQQVPRSSSSGNTVDLTRFTRAPQKKTQATTKTAEPTNSSQEKEKVKESAKESVKKATSKPPTNPSQKPKVAMKAGTRAKKQPKKGK